MHLGLYMPAVCIGVRDGIVDTRPTVANRNCGQLGRIVDTRPCLAICARSQKCLAIRAGQLRGSGQPFVAACADGQTFLAPCAYGQTFATPCAYGQTFPAPCAYGQTFPAPCAYGQTFPAPCAY